MAEFYRPYTTFYQPVVVPVI